MVVAPPVQFIVVPHRSDSRRLRLDHIGVRQIDIMPINVRSYLVTLTTPLPFEFLIAFGDTKNTVKLMLRDVHSAMMSHGIYPRYHE